MFKTKEELKKQFVKDVGKGESPNLYNGFEEGTDDAFESIAERVEFFREHIDDKELFKQSHLKDYKRFLEVAHYITWEKWLVDFCFGDIE